MSSDIFLKLVSDSGPLKGESMVKGFEEQIQLVDWHWGAAQTGTAHVGSGGGTGKVQVKNLSFSHYMDTASPTLFLACCKGTHFNEATLTMRKAAGESPLAYLIITLKYIIVTAVSINASGGAELPQEVVTLNFAAFEMSYQAQAANGGKKGGAIHVAYDIVKNS